MNTPNLDKVRNEPYPNDLQLAVMFYGDEQTCSSDEELQDAEKAAEILAAMQARIEKLERVEKIARQIYKLFSKTEIIDIDEQYFNVWSIVGDAEKDELEDALKGEE